MRNILRRISRKRFPYEPLITVEVSKSRILANLEAFKGITKGKLLAPVLKSNAYGHGLFEIAKILKNDKDLPFFIVDSYFEAVALRSNGITKPLVIVGFNRVETIKTSYLSSVSFAITSIESLSGVYDIRKPIKIHLKIDTGMHRQGVLPQEIDQALTILLQNKNLTLDGIFTHFSHADNTDQTFTKKQIKVWNDCVAKIIKVFPKVRYIHAAATDGSVLDEDISSNLVRLGIGLYGLSENPRLHDIAPILSMKTIVTGVKKLAAGETVGYGNTYKAAHDMMIATIPVGYFEGLDRRLSSAGVVQLGPNDVSCPIIGRVSMNITTIDVSGVPEVKIGDEVQVISADSSKQNSIFGIAKICKSITYEVVVKIPAHLKRVVTK